jgi:hypothetical protein
MPVFSLARWLVALGLVLILAGGIVYLAGRLGLQPGRLPGDLRLERGSLTCLVPLGSSLLISIVLTVLLNLLIRLLNR